MSDDTHDHTSVAQFAVGSAALAVDSLRQLTRGSARVVRRLGDRGSDAVAEGRDAAIAALRVRVEGSIDWIATTVAPKLIDRMTPYLAETVAPRLVDRMMPYLAETVAPKLIDRMTPYLAETVAPRLVDRMMPYLVGAVVPRMIDGALPHIRAKVVPVIIEDLTHDPEVREMISEQGRGVLTDAALQLRESSATADDRVETGFRKLLHLPQTQN